MFGSVHPSVHISRSIQNGWAFKMVVVSTGCAIAVDHAFNYFNYTAEPVLGVWDVCPGMYEESSNSNCPMSATYLIIL